MKNNPKILFLTFLIAISLLSACGNSPTDSANELSNNDRADEDQYSIENENNKETNKQNTAGNTRDENDATNHSEDSSNNKNSSESSDIDSEMIGSNKDLYLKKLDDTKNEVDEWEATDSSTYALKDLENQRWETWDDLLNEVYSVLQKELSAEEMDTLRDEQRNWIKHRDDTALEASEKFKGSTQEQLEYVATLANLTEERCYELVKNYM